MHLDFSDCNLSSKVAQLLFRLNGLEPVIRELVLIVIIVASLYGFYIIGIIFRCSGNN